MAAAFFNARADPAKARGVSAGTDPAERIHAEVVGAMLEAGLDLSQARPQKLTLELASDADLLVTMGCGESCPFIPGLRVEDWALEDPKGKPIEHVRSIRDQIRALVLGLIERENLGRNDSD